MEKPKMTHKKVRRISFMETFSKRCELTGDAINAKAIEAPGLAPDHGRRDTMGGNGLGV
jgi:hypothetical protein